MPPALRTIRSAQTGGMGKKGERTPVKKIISLVLTLALLAGMAACGQNAAPSPQGQPSAPGSSESAPAPEPEPAGDNPPDMGPTILIAAAASLEYSFRDELIPLFREKYPNIPVEGTYDASGKLQTQIEEGLEADLFFSAAQKQMNALRDERMVDADSIVELLENKVVLITPAGADGSITSFEEIDKADTIALGDPDSVPVGQYSREILQNLGLWDTIQPKLSLGTNVTQVLNWVAEGSADVGAVYATDAATTDRVTVVAEAPEGSLVTPVIYPVGIVSSSRNKEAARLFLEFLQSDEALAIFQKYGFAAA